MQVQVKVKPTDMGLSLTPMKYRRTERYVGTAIISNAEITDGVATGELVGEYLETYPLSTASLPGPVLKRLRPLTDNISKARILYATTDEVFYLP